MFGGGDRYVETLDGVLSFVSSHEPTTDELVGWHRGTFEQVSSRDSILRRVDYLEDVGFLTQKSGLWQLGEEGQTYMADRSTETLLEIMVRRNVGLRSLLYALSAGPMSIEEINDQQLTTHPELGWDPANTDMAVQRVNWLRSLGLVQKDGADYTLTEEGRAFTEAAVSEWADSEASDHSGEFGPLTAGTYETVVEARAVDPEFRATVLTRYERTCPVSGVDHTALLDVAHVLPWSEYPSHRADLGNVLPLSKIHHAAFDRELFTIDRDYRVRVNPAFETESTLLKQSILEQAGTQISIPSAELDASYLRRHNDTLDWLTS